MKHLASESGASAFDALETDLTKFSRNWLRNCTRCIRLATFHQPETGWNLSELTIQCKRANTLVRAKSGYYARKVCENLNRDGRASIPRSL